MRQKTFFLISLISGLLLITPIPAAAAERSYPLFDLRVGRWFSKGDASWQISFLNLAGTTTESELEYDDIDSDLLLLEARFRPSAKLSLSLNMGLGGIDNARYTDTDRTDAWTWSESRGDVDGDVRLWGGNLYLHLLPLDDSMGIYAVEKTSDFWLDLFIGFQHYTDRLRMYYGVQTVSETELTPPVGTVLSGLNSTYNFEWYYVQVGAQAGLSFISVPRPALHDLGISGSLGLIPFLSYEGEGIWNLRSDFRQDPSFQHKSNSGMGIDTSLSLNYSPHKLIEIAFGYRYLYLRADEGTDTTFFSSGCESTVDLDEVRVRRHGPFVTLSMRF